MRGSVVQYSLHVTNVMNQEEEAAAMINGRTGSEINSELLPNKNVNTKDAQEYVSSEIWQYLKGSIKPAVGNWSRYAK